MFGLTALRFVKTSHWETIGNGGKCRSDDDWSHCTTFRKDQPLGKTNE